MGLCFSSQNDNEDTGTPNKLKSQDDTTGNPPPYRLRVTADGALLSTIQRCTQLGEKYGIQNGLISPLNHRCIRIWLDDSAKLGKSTQSAILANAQLLLLLGQATGCVMEFCFMSMRNTNSSDLLDQDRKKAEALDQLWSTENLNGAKQCVEDNTALSGMGFEKWFNNSSAGKNATETESPKEKQISLLKDVRERLGPLWQGYKPNELTLDSLKALYEQAQEESKKQPMVREAVRFALEREVGQYKRLRKGRQATPTTSLILTGSPLHPDDVEAITEFHKTDSTEKAKGSVSQFCISIVAFIGQMDGDVRDNYHRLDTSFKGDNDIYDVVQIDEKELLSKGPSESLLFKILNSHNKQVDNMRVKAGQWYGTSVIAGPGQDWIMPSLEQVTKALMRDG